MASHQPDEVIRPGEEEWAGGDKQRAGPLLDQRCNGRVDVALAAGSEDDEPQSDRACCARVSVVRDLATACLGPRASP